MLRIWLNNWFLQIVRYCRIKIFGTEDIESVERFAYLSVGY